MFIATNAPEKSRSIGAKPGSGTFAETGKAVALLGSLRVKKEPLGYKHLAPLGRSDNDVLLHFRVEAANDK